MKSKDLCTVKHAWALDNIIRKLLQNPKRILKNYIKEGMTILDFGCGPGVFSITMAEMVGENGKVIAADLQQEMLDILADKISGKVIENRIVLHKCEDNKIDIKEKVDFIIALYVIHETPYEESILKELYSVLKKEGLLYIAEPSFHVSEKKFQETIENALNIGFRVVEKPKVMFTRAVVFRK